MSSSDSSFEFSSPSDKRISNFLKVEGCCVSGIRRFIFQCQNPRHFYFRFLKIFVFTNIPFTCIPNTLGGPLPFAP